MDYPQKPVRGRRAAARPFPGALRLAQYLFLIAVIAVALVVIVPFVGSEPMRRLGGADLMASSGKDEPAGTPAPKLSKKDKARNAAADFWQRPFAKVKVSLSPEEWEYLGRDERRYAKATVEEDGRIYPHVALKLKGSAGSFQGRDGRPGLTLNFDYYKGADLFHGLEKIHFNNSVQDGTFLHEKIAGEMARKAGVPASRCTYAFLTFQGRDLGLYVIKEAFTNNFLAAFYTKPNGDLYDGGFLHEVDETLEKDQGDPKDRGALKELVSACDEGDPAKRWERLGKILDVEKFASYCAMEAILCHWDGYSFNRNNYRLYRDAESGKFSFFLHGMDQTFGDTNFPVFRNFDARVSGAFMRCPEGERLYRSKLEEIYRGVLKAVDWGARVSEVGEEVRAAMEKINPQAARDYAGRIKEARSQITERIAAVGRMLGEQPKAFAFDKNGAAKIEGEWNSQGGAAELDERDMDGRRCFYIKAGNDPGSWRHALSLPAGRYRFEARVKSKGAVGGSSSSGEGAGVRISGSSRKGLNGLVGDSDWKLVGFDFEASGGEVVLVAELAGNAGEAWFEKASMRLVRRP